MNIRDALHERVTNRARSRKPFEFFECRMYSGNFVSSAPSKVYSLSWIRWFGGLTRGDRVEVDGLDNCCLFIRGHRNPCSNLVLVQYLGADLKWHRSYVEHRRLSMPEDK